jgi:pre-mRNA-processing factor 40
MSVPTDDIMDAGEELLKTLLKEKNVSSNCSWENAIKCMEADPRFESVRSLPNRKFIFNEYKQQKAKEEKEELRLKVKKAKEDLESFLNNDPRVTSALRYRQACEEFSGLDVWKNVPDDERHDIFEDVMLEVKKREDDRARELRKRNREVLRDILDSIPDITAHTSWLKAQQLLSQNEVFTKDPNLHAMDKLDALEVFMEYIEQLEDEEKEERRRERKERAKQERENRFAFVRFLDELHAAGHLTSISKWQNLYQTISCDSRYIALLSQPLTGSTALDLFKFYVEDLKARYEDEKQIINEILKARNFNITLETTFVDFATFVSEDERSANLDGGNLKMIFERLAEKEREKERLRVRQLMKEKRKLEQALFAVLEKHINTEDEVNLEWEEVRPLICDEPAFKAIEKEEERIEIYKNYLNTVHDTCLHHHKKPKNSKCSHHSYSPPSITDSPPSGTSCIDPNSIDLGELERKRRQIIEELRSSKR